MDKIELRRMPFFARHGVFPEEQKLGQRFVVSLVLFLDLSVAGQSDDVADTVDYGNVYLCVKRIVEEEVFQLIEALAERIAQDITGLSGLIQGVRVEVEKPGAPVAGILETVGITIERWRSQPPATS